MRSRHILYLAAAASFWLVGAPSVNSSEAINVVLPSQYQVIWDQAPFATASKPVTERVPGRVEIAVPSPAWSGSTLGSFARAFLRRGTEPS